MPSYVQTSRGFVNKATGEVEPLINRIYSENSPPPLPSIDRSDEQPPLVSMADGKTYTSKAAMRESYRAANNPQGVNYVELGNEVKAKAPAKPKPDRAAIKETVQRAESILRTRGEWA